VAAAGDGPQFVKSIRPASGVPSSVVHLLAGTSRGRTGCGPDDTSEGIGLRRGAGVVAWSTNRTERRAARVPLS